MKMDIFSLYSPAFLYQTYHLGYVVWRKMSRKNSSRIQTTLPDFFLPLTLSPLCVIVFQALTPFYGA